MKIITGKEWNKAVYNGSININNKKNAINALNVFPVPDGDTGSNMSSTISSACNSECLEDDCSIESASRIVAQNMLMSARGNSGVILSQIFKGFSNGFASKKSANAFDLVNAFEMAAKSAYGAVLKPVEGTILTVIREVSEGLKNQVVVDTTIEEVFEIAVKLARKSCDGTPKLLKILKEVGVTDSGGEGLYAILQGMSAYFSGNKVEPIVAEESVEKFISDEEVYEGEFGYCTEFILELYKPKKFDKDYLVRKLEKIGNSMVVVNDDKILKVHIHTPKPGDVLNSVNSLGQFVKIKIDNMTLQANNSKKTAKKKQTEAPSNVELKNSAIVSCNTGQGIVTLMKENGVSYVVDGGQTNNPSIQDIVNAINAVNAKTVFVLPNNSNIILSAQQAGTIIRDKNVIIIPTRSQVQGLNVALNYSSENSDEENHELMSNSLKHIRYGEIAAAIKDAKLNGIKVKASDYMVIVEGKLQKTSKSLFNAAQLLVSELVSDDSQVVTIIYGQDVSENDALELQNYIETTYDLVVEIYQGDQGIYPYLISVE
ncbi:DAK2 domain-containing protein [Metamycoplasma hominis]|uniref:DAK2 domain-containing protein n=1 Tax=Metamycoplasma hominis TaxID=2098 RepID=UPI00158DE708|nr:DAK2 domain-containing protein [Metamycoplasma hominis]QKX40772.1 DAK2 domain-containing protein [Metamycoplasma hominis]